MEKVEKFHMEMKEKTRIFPYTESATGSFLCMLWHKNQADASMSKTRQPFSF